MNMVPQHVADQPGCVHMYVQVLVFCWYDLIEAPYLAQIPMECKATQALTGSLAPHMETRTAVRRALELTDPLSFKHLLQGRGAVP